MEGRSSRSALDPRGHNPSVAAEPTRVRAPDAIYDAGDLGCGDLVLELAMRLRAMRPGQVLEVVARDLGAPEDLPAWCSMTGNVLESARPPIYRIRRKPD